MESARYFIITKKGLAFQIVTDFKKVTVTVLCEDEHGFKQTLAHTHKVVIETLFITRPANKYSHLLKYFSRHGWNVEELQ